MESFLRRYRIIIMVILFVAPMAAGFILLRMATYGPDSSDTHRVTQVIGGSFALVGPGDQVMTPASWPGKLLLITFGYRFCPDICPTNLGTMARALDLLGADGAGFQPLFVTVDPDRDTVANLADYVTQFHPRLVGLTGTHTQIDAVARTFGVYYLKVAGAAPDAYTVDHSSYLYVADDHGKVMKIFSHDITAEQLAAGLKALLPHAAS